MNSTRCKIRRFRTLCATGILLTLGCVVPTFSAKANDEKKSVAKGPITTLWAIPKELSLVTLTTLSGEVVPLIVQPDTIFAGMCVHCNMVMEVKASQAARECARCACNYSNAECFAHKIAGKKGWAEMLAALPKGTVLRIEYVEPGKADSGLKRLTIDPRTVLLPISGATTPSLDAVTAAAKAVGGANVEMGDDGKRLLIHLKSDWTQDRETRLVKALATLGVEVSFPPQKADPK